MVVPQVFYLEDHGGGASVDPAFAFTGAPPIAHEGR